MGIEEGLSNIKANDKKDETKMWFQKLIQQNAYVGELFSINYESARIVIHDSQRKDVGGIPSLSFLIATRIDPTMLENIDFKQEDASFILLRVMDSAPLPQDQEAERIRVETSERVSGEISQHWDSDGAMDAKTRVLLGYAGVECRIIGTFFLEENPAVPDAPLMLSFGSDISNYYPNRGLKVYKPHSEALKQIVNYRSASTLKEQEEAFNISSTVKLGYVRYASTNRKFQQVDDVEVNISPADLLDQKSALFGMTRTGKSNTTKIIAKSVFELRRQNNDGKTLRIGQIIFDPNGEYANENVQDKGALKNIWKVVPNTTKNKEVITYGITKHPNDPDRILMLLNFYLDENLQIGKEIIDSLLSEDTTTYIKNFLQVAFEKPDENDRSATTRYNRRVLAYRAVLARSGFSVPSNLSISTKGLFNKDLLSAMQNSSSDNAVDYQSAARIFSGDRQTLDQLSIAFEALDKFIRDKDSGYSTFESNYVNRSGGSGDRWADEDLKKIIGIFQYPNGTRKIGKAAEQHSADTKEDYSLDIYNHLLDGKLVIIDQSTGDPELNESSARRIITQIFKGQQKLFIQGKQDIPHLLVYLEEAHTLLPSGSESNLKDIWVRTAKEGAKYRIGMIYATQEVSSIQKNILKNTANWFISHLNNTDETKELCKYYDFKDFEPSIRRAQDKGFLRIKTLSNPFVISVQVDKFEIPDEGNSYGV
jgi:hypothetical protein